MAKSVLLFGNYPPPHGGVPTHIQYLSRHLVRRGWDVQVLSFSHGPAGVTHVDGCTIYRPSVRGRWLRLLAPQPADLTRLRRFGPLARQEPKSYLSWSATAHLVRMIMRRHRVAVVAAYHVLGPGVISAWVCEQLGVPLITTVFGEIYAHPEQHRRRLAEVEYVLRQSKRMLSCSNHCAQSFRAIGLDPEVETVYYGIDTARFAPSLLNPASRRVLYCARMVEEMGLHVLLQSILLVLERDPSVQFEILGRSGELTPAALELQRRFPANLVVEPDLPDHALPGRYDAAALTVAPSINARACLGLAIAEAMATGRPVIGSRVGGTAEVLVDGETGLLVPPSDPGALADAILSLLAQPERAAAMGRAGRERAVQLFDQARTNERMEQLFEEVMQ